MTDIRVEDRDLIQGDDTLGLDQAEPKREEAEPQDEAPGPNESTAVAAGTDQASTGGADALDDGGLADEAAQEPAEGRRDVG